MIAPDYRKARGVLHKSANDEHKARHVELHKKLDELLADFIGHTGKTPSHTTIMELLTWSFEQTNQPTEGGLTQQ